MSTGRVGGTMADLFADPVTPGDIALVIGLPCDADAFLDDVAMRSDIPTDGRGDFAALQVNQFTPASERRALAERHAHLIEDLLATATAAGVRLSRTFAGADLHDLAAAFQSGARVVIIVAHWRGCGFTRPDFAPDVWPRLSGRIADDDAAIARTLSDHLADATEGVPPSPGRLADLLNDFVARVGGEHDRSTVRDALDAFLPDCFAPGNGLELRDGIHKSDLVADEIPADWSGVVDLGICESFRLAEAMKEGRQDRRILTNKKAKMLGRIVPELREVLLSLAATPGPYIPLKARTHGAYTDLITEKSA
jgi:hypothetical protein